MMDLGLVNDKELVDLAVEAMKRLIEHDKTNQKNYGGKNL